MGIPGGRMMRAEKQRWKRHDVEEIIEKLAEANRMVSRGAGVAEAAQAIGVTDVTYLRWRKQYGGLSAAQLKHIKMLEAENARLRRAIVELEMGQIA